MKDEESAFLKALSESIMSDLNNALASGKSIKEIAKDIVDSMAVPLEALHKKQECHE